MADMEEGKMKENKKYGRMTIIGEPFKRPSKIGKSIYVCVLCKCDCGNEKITRLSFLRSGETKSCGCMAKELSSQRNKKHGLSKHPIRLCWSEMKQRCYNLNYINYKNWGGRGITICDEWKNNFLSFYDWALGNGWQKGLQIDRINNDGNYEPPNCRFVTAKINMRNRRGVKLNMEKANQIRGIYSEGKLSQRKIASTFGVSFFLVNSIIKNRQWV